MPGPSDVPGWSVRTALPTDDGALARFHNRVRSGLAGVILRSEADFAWRYRRQPALSPEGIFLAEDTSGTILGYAVVKDNGDIQEFVIDEGRHRRDVAKVLIESCEALARSSGAQRIRVHVPADDDLVQDVFAEAGLGSAVVDQFEYVTLSDPPPLFRYLAGHARDPDLPAAITVTLRDPFPEQKATWHVPLGRDVDAAPEFEVISIRYVLNRVLLAGTSPAMAVLRRQIRVRPSTKMPRAVRLLSALQVERPWYYSLGEVQ